MRYVFLSILIGGLSLTTPCYGKSAGEFLKMGISARPLGMGGAFCAVADDISSIHYNQAGLVKIKAQEFIATGTKLGIEDMYKASLGYGRKLSEDSAFGISIIYLDKGDFDLRRKEDDTYSLASIGQDIALILSFSKSLKVLSLGVNAKVISSELYDESGKGISGDIGILLFPEAPLSIGINCQNIGSIEIREREDLPFNIKGGVALRSSRFVLAIDVNSFRDNTKWHGGLEYLISDSFIIRGGYSTEDVKGFLPGVSLGFGYTDKKGPLFREGEIEIDYALRSLGDLGLDHLISLVFKF